MKVVTSILSAVALVLVPCFTVHANELIAGPIPADFDFGVVTCSAANVLPLAAPQPTENITLELLDRTGKGVVGGAVSLQRRTAPQLLLRLQPAVSDWKWPLTLHLPYL
jgi:hypothetical protein